MKIGPVESPDSPPLYIHRRPTLFCPEFGADYKCPDSTQLNPTIQGRGYSLNFRGSCNDLSITGMMLSQLMQQLMQCVCKQISMHIRQARWHQEVYHSQNYMYSRAWNLGSQETGVKIIGTGNAKGRLMAGSPAANMDSFLPRIQRILLSKLPLRQQ